MPSTFRFNTSKLEEGIRKELMAEPARAIRAMNAVGGYLNGEAKDRAPVDRGDLTASISNDTVRNPKSYSAVIYVPVNSPSAKYAISMHENRYNLGKGSVEKMKKVGVPVGRKYLTRAIEENIKTSCKIIAKEISL